MAAVALVKSGDDDDAADSGHVTASGMTSKSATTQSTNYKMRMSKVTKGLKTVSSDEFQVLQLS